MLDNSVENLASGAWQALGNALKGGTKFVQKYVAFLSLSLIMMYFIKSCNLEVLGPLQFSLFLFKFCLNTK